MEIGHLLYVLCIKLSYGETLGTIVTLEKGLTLILATFQNLPIS